MPASLLPKNELQALTLQGLEADLADISAHLLAHGWMLATAESCTGGLIAAACTERAGSSQWFERGFVSYANAAKTELLGVPSALIDAHGAVSEPVVRAMAEGALPTATPKSAWPSLASPGPAAPAPTNPSAPCALAGAAAQKPTAK